jgi:subtilase family serine protease
MHYLSCMKMVRHRIVTCLVLALLSLFVSPTLATGVTSTFNLVSSLRVNPAVTLLDPSFNPQKAPVGGAPFCSSASLGSILCYPPNFLKTAYDFPSGLDGTGQTIVIVDAFGSPTIQTDLNAFDTAFNLPAAGVTILCGPAWAGSSSDTCPAFDLSLPVDKACGALGWWEETTLDVSMSHALAPGAKIVLVVANDCQDASINSAERAVVIQPSLKGSIMSQSFGVPDDLVGCLNFPCTKIDHSIKQTADRTYDLARINGWTVIASSGDNGANEALSAVGTTELTPSWPASNPLNLAAGGTQGQPYGGDYGAPPGPDGTNSCPANTDCNTGLVVINGGPNGCETATRPGVPTSCTPVRYGGEAAWNEFNVFKIGTSTGGGVSAQYRLASYQSHFPKSFPTLLGSSVKANGRLTPDVSFNSAIQGGALAHLGFLGRWGVFGGTSAASPAWAGIIALLNQAHGGPLGFLNTAIYNLGASSNYHASFHDIILGNNSDTAGNFGVDGFIATPGYDLTTGWGTPDVANFITNIAAICASSCPSP